MLVEIQDGTGKLSMLTLISVFTLLWFQVQMPAAAQESPKPPTALEVLPVFFVPGGEAPPSPDEKKLVLDHLKWTRDIYRKLLKGQTTFRIAGREPLVLDAARKLEFYRQLPEAGVPEMLGEVLDHLKQDRFSTPYVFLITVTNRADDFPGGGGRPINGGNNEGGGVMCFSQYNFNKIAYVQSTLQHEIGHGFGLMHVDAYQYDISQNPSLMSYKQSHHTNGFTDSTDPGTLIPEDIRGLAINDRGFEKLTFSATRDVPENYRLCTYVPSLPPMRIAGQPDYSIQLSSECPDEFASKLGNIVQKQIFPNRGPGITYIPNFMWSTSPDATGWVKVNVKLPRPMALDRFVVYSEHSGQYHRIAEMKIAVAGKKGARQLASKPVNSDEFHLKCPRTEAQEWVLSFRPGTSGKIVIRGLRFFDGEQEWFKPSVVLP